MESIEMPRVQVVAVVGSGMERGRERKRQRGGHRKGGREIWMSMKVEAGWIWEELGKAR